MKQQKGISTQMYLLDPWHMFWIVEGKGKYGFP